MSEADFMQHGLEQAEQLTGSQIAFIHFVNDDQQTIELVTWSRATLEHYCHAAFDNHYPISQAGIWADALRQRMPVVFNDYANAADKHGLPDGHAHIERLISVPVIDGGLVRMIAGVGNKLETYSDHDVETVRLVANTVWRIVRQRRADAALKASEARYRAVDQSANDAMVTIDITGNIVGHNPATARLFGYAETELSGQALTMLLPERFGNITLPAFKNGWPTTARRSAVNPSKSPGGARTAANFRWNFRSRAGHRAMTCFSPASCGILRGANRRRKSCD